MIFKSQFPGSPDTSVVISGVSVDYTSIESVRVDLHEGLHDYAEIVFVGLPPRAITDYIGAPVYISIAGSPASICSFFGYVSFVEPEMVTRRGLVNNSPVQRARVGCMSASFDMTNEKNRVWENISLPNLVSKIADEYNYSYSVPEDHFTWGRLLQNRKSDWALLKDACHSIGYYITTNGTHIHVYDPYKAIGRQMPYVELTSVRGSDGSATYYPGRIMEFTGTFGDITREGKFRKIELVGVDSFGSVVTAEAGDDVYTKLGEKVEPRYKDQVGTNTSSVEMLNRYAEGAARGQYPFNATASVTGVANVVPGSVALINNYDSDFDGYWLVQGVRHMVTRSNYVTELDMVTDSTSRARPTVDPVAAFVQPPEPRLTNNRWESTTVFEDVYV